MAEKLISTLHCFLLPSVKDYPTAAVVRGFLSTLRRGEAWIQITYSHIRIYINIYSSIQPKSTYLLTRGIGKSGSK